MYRRVTLKLYERSFCRVLGNVRFQCNTLDHVKKKDVEKQTMELTSKKFPGYKLIYVFPYIAHVSAISKAKRRFTYLTGATVPLMLGSWMANVVSFNTAGASISTVLILAGWLHTTTIFCTNLVGLIYVNLEEDKVILSYMDYWGKRIDLKTNIDDVVPISDNRTQVTDPLYKKILFYSQSKKLKINLRLGKITDVRNFQSLLGII